MTSRIATANRKLNPVAKAIIQYIKDNGEVTRTQLFVNLTDYPTKKILAGLRLLNRNNMLKTIPNLKEDMRKIYYVLS